MANVVNINKTIGSVPSLDGNTADKLGNSSEITVHRVNGVVIKTMRGNCKYPNNSGLTENKLNGFKSGRLKNKFTKNTDLRSLAKVIDTNAVDTCKKRGHSAPSNGKIIIDNKTRRQQPKRTAETPLEKAENVVFSERDVFGLWRKSKNENSKEFHISVKYLLNKSELIIKKQHKDIIDLTFNSSCIELSNDEKNFFTLLVLYKRKHKGDLSESYVRKCFISFVSDTNIDEKHIFQVSEDNNKSRVRVNDLVNNCSFSDVRQKMFDKGFLYSGD